MTQQEIITHNNKIKVQINELKNQLVGIIYSATNTETELVYIGQTTVGLEMRKAQHYKDARKPKYKFQRALKNSKTFDWVWKVEYEGNNLNEKEIELIKSSNSYRKGYNSTIGGVVVKGNKRNRKNSSSISIKNNNFKSCILQLRESHTWQQDILDKKLNKKYSFITKAINILGYKRIEQVGYNITAIKKLLK
jgi:hypothetical protein